MKILFDHNTPQRLRRHLRDHAVTTTRQMQWEELANGLLLRAAADEPFDLLLTLDKKMEYEHNLTALPLPIVLFGTPKTAMADLIPLVPALRALLEQPLTPALYVITTDGTVVRLTTPRPKR